MIPTWPTDLPTPVRDSLRIQRIDARRRRAGETGPPRYARRTSAVARQIALTLILDRERLGVLTTFFVETLQEGALPFRMPDPIWDGIPLLDSSGGRIDTEADVPILVTRQMLCLWGDEPPVEGPLKGGEMPVSFSVWDLPQ